MSSYKIWQIKILKNIQNSKNVRRHVSFSEPPDWELACGVDISKTFEMYPRNRNASVGCRSIQRRILIGIGLLLAVVVHGKEFEDKMLPQAIRDRRACFTQALRTTLAYDLNQNYVRTSRFNVVWGWCNCVEWTASSKTVLYSPLVFPL